MSKTQDTTREARLKAALKANMARRKAQTRARGSTPNTNGRKAEPTSGAKGSGNG